MSWKSNNEIKTAKDLEEFRDEVNGGNFFQGQTITLINDINLSGSKWEPIGKNEKCPFLGVFDGNCKIIDSIKINYNADCKGLFGVIGKGGIVKNLNLVNVNIDGSLPGNNEIAKGSGNSVVGGLVGRNDGTIENCSISGKVKGGDCVGGLIGHNGIKGIINNCYTNVIVYGNQFAGGFVGVNNGGKIKNCHAMGDVKGDSTVGGFIGFNHSSLDENSVNQIANCYSVGKVDGVVNCGGFIGEKDKNVTHFSSKTISSCYYDKDTSGQMDNDGRGEPKVTDEMKDDTTYDGCWDFGSVWTIDKTGKTNNGYPFLQNLAKFY
jgi:uncharacterized Zn ribbon protein